MIEPRRSGRLSEDTDSKIEAMHIAAWRAMSPADKAAQVTASFHALAELSEAGVRLNHPDASAFEVRMRVASLRLGADLVKAAYGWEPPRAASRVRTVQRPQSRSRS